VVIATTYLGGTLALIDSIILVATVIAQLMLDNKKVENWIVWGVVNVAAIYTYFHTGLFLVGVQYIFFLANTVYGYIEWRKSQKTTLPPSPVAREEQLDIWDEFEFKNVDELKSFYRVD
jgi:nicotinamide mononucleotide transporter PnuC